MELTELTQKALQGSDLSTAEAEQAIVAMIDGGPPDEQMAKFLTALAEKGEAYSELAGAARALRGRMRRIRTTRENVLDTCGTGGDASGTFNISSAAALVAASAGVAVAKHGNRSVTSKTGSADVLARLGVNVEAPLAVVERCLDELGICFCFAPQLHPAIARVSQIRRQLGRPTIFNWVGPLCNPAEAPFQLLGVGKPAIRSAMASALQTLGTRRGAVVCGSDGLDEVTLAGETFVSIATAAGIVECVWHPSDFGLRVTGLESMKVANVEASATMILDVLRGERGPARDIVLLNAAAALWVAQIESQLADCVRRVAEAVDAENALRLLAELSRVSQDV